MASAVTMSTKGLVVPDEPILPFIEGDGTGPDIWAASVRVFDSAVAKAYGGKRRVEWREVLAGEKAFNATGEWLPQATLDDFKTYLLGIKGPLTTPVGGGIRSLNVALRQILDLYVCLRPVRWFEGVPSPVKDSGAVDMVIFRENTEDIYAGIEFAAGTTEAQEVLDFFQAKFPKMFDKVRFGTAKRGAEFASAAGMSRTSEADNPVMVGVGIKPVSRMGSERLIRAAIQYAIDNGRKSVTLVHKGNIMKFTEGAFKDWGYELAKERFGAELLDGGPWMKMKNPKTGKDIIIKDVIADAFLQQILMRPADYSVIATLNLNGDYISDALAAEVGGIGIAPGANIGGSVAMFEATHGTAPKYAGQDKVNPGSIILSAEMMLRHMGWTEAADLIIKGTEGAIAAKTVTYDFERLMPDATLLKCSEFGDAIIKHMA